MAPVKATAVGITPQIIDDNELSKLQETLNSFSIKNLDANLDQSFEVDQLLKMLKNFSEWKFEEQVDLYEWIPTLNSVDALLSHYVANYPSLLLLAPVERQKSPFEEKEANKNQYADCALDAESVPDSVIDGICTILKFLSSLLSNCTNKSVFNSVEEIVDLLAAGDDSIAALSLQTLAHVATPPALHKQQAPDGNQHSSALHTSKTDSHKRLVALARGWGSRGSGLGLYACVTADDSEFGQGELPPAAGEINFEFFAPAPATDSNAMQLDGDKGKKDKLTERIDHTLVSIHIPTEEIVTVAINSGSMDTDTDSSFTAKKQKRQRTGTKEIRAKGMKTLSTVRLFFKCLEAAGGREKIPQDRLFALLADIRLARSFHSTASRINAIENRLVALITILHAHPSQDIMSGYFQAQPELCVELIDLLRPTISSNTVSSASAKLNESSTLKSIAALACPQEIPYSVRNLAVEALTALVARRDGASGGLTGVARQSNILNELGVGKGMYLGLLPTLVRYSLASLTNFLTADEQLHGNLSLGVASEMDDVALDIGLAFLEASSPLEVSEKDQIFRALRFVDSVLTLTSAVVSAPSGTAALTDCGMIPALVSTSAFNTEKPLSALTNLSVNFSKRDLEQIHGQVRFVASQAIQIIEGAIVTHNNALSAFHDLKGVDVLITRLEKEMVAAKEEQLTREADSMKTDNTSETHERKLVASRRVLLFSIVNCLTVVFHQESNSSTTSNGGTQLRKPALTFVITEVMNYIESYGGVFAALICTLLSDVMNSDPHVVYHVHKSGIAKSFIEMVKGERINTCDEALEPIVPPVPELIMALPNVIAALALTSEGASQVSQSNPFPALLKILYHPKYVMPRSRCLLNEMTAITGTGLDEVMRHVPTLRAQIMESIVESMNKVIMVGKKLVEDEESSVLLDLQDSLATSLENERTCLIQYTLNFGQMLEQILHTEDHCEPFVDAGGLTAILELFPLLVPPTTQFLANSSCLSSPSVSTLAHTTTEDSLATSFRCVAMNYDSQKMLNIMSKFIEHGIKRVEVSQRLVRSSFPSPLSNIPTLHSSDKRYESLDVMGILDGMPNVGIHELQGMDNYLEKSKCLADYLRSVVTLQWLTNLLATVVKAAYQSSQDGGTGWGRAEREWKRELASSKYEDLMNRLAEFHYSAILEACRVRSQKDYESEFRQRHIQRNCEGKSVRYRLKIVCQEGAVLRDGIEIDSCSNVGSMEMGEVTDAFDRCVNSSGIMRYRTRRGWVSEVTRGHGREPIAEVLDVSFVDSALVPELRTKIKSKKRMEYKLASIRSVGASILARLQTSYRDLFSSLNRVISHGVKSLTARTVSFSSGTIGDYTKTLLRVMLTSITNALNQPSAVQVIAHSGFEDSILDPSGVAMYLGTMLGIIGSYLFDDKRERRMMNGALIIGMLNSDHYYCNNSSKKLISDERMRSGNIAPVGIFDGIKFVMENALQSAFSLGTQEKEYEKLKPVQSLFRTTAASLPPVLDFLRKLMSGLPTKQSSMTNALERIEYGDLVTLLGGSGEDYLNITFCRTDGKDRKFSFGQFVKGTHFTIAELVINVWKDERLKYMPSYVVHPLTILSTEIIGGLEEDIKPASSSNIDQRRGFFNRVSRGSAGPRQRPSEQVPNVEQPFEPSDEAVTRLMEMGFSRDHAFDAIENTGSNRLEVAMEYALSHPPPSPVSAERRREARRQRNEAQRNQNEDNDEAMNEPAENDSSPEGEQLGKENKSKAPPSEDAEKEETTESKIISKIKICLHEWIESMPSIAASLIGDGSNLLSNDARISQVEGKGNGDAEALTVVVCSFLIGLCQKYPTKMEVSFRGLLSTLKGHLELNSEKTICSVKKGSEMQVSALCHAAVLYTRAVPKTRVIVLEFGLVRNFLSCIDELSSSLCPLSQVSWPMWLAPALLLLDVMAQPFVAFELNSIDDNENLSDKAIQNDLPLVKVEHMRKRVSLSQSADQLFDALKSSKQDAEKAKISKKGVNSSDSAITETKSVDTSVNTPTKLTSADGSKPEQPKPDAEFSDLSIPRSAFSKIPPFFPLITDEMAKSAMSFCLRILGKASTEPRGVSPPPGVVHAVLLLMARLVRSDMLASDCLKAHAPDLILALPRACRFNNNAGLVTIIFRRLLEDDSNLQIAMETEIRGVLSKLHRKQNRQSSTSSEPSASMHSFLQAVTPLLYREPLTFLKAMLSTVSFDSLKREKEGNSVTLLSQTERQNNLRAFSKVRPRSSRIDSSVDTKKLKLATPKFSKAKLSHRGSLSRRGSFSKRSRKDKGDTSLNGTPSNHVISLMIEKLLLLSSNNGDDTTSDKFGDETSFLWVSDILEIMADLVLAVPTCAAAIHRYRLPSNKGQDSDCNPLSNLRHALTGSEVPSKTVVNFLLHCLLPQDRWSYRQEQELLDRQNHEDESWKLKKKESYMKTKVAQTTARLLVSLVARAGEGRRRVLAGLSFALNGGREHEGDKSVATSYWSCEEPSKDLELCALRAWGDLCIGLAAPRSNGVNHDNDSNLSIDVVRLMLDFKMAHALLHAIGRVNLQHPMATSSCGSLLVPLEVFTRASVTEAIQSLLAKEETDRETGSKVTNNAKGVKKKESLHRATSLGSSRRIETAFADDAMLADGFDAEAAIQNDICDEDVDMIDEDDHDGVDVDVDMEDQSEEEDENDEEEEESDIGSGEETEDDEEDEDDDDDSEERDDDDDDDDGANDEVEEGEDGMWNEEMGEFFDGNGDDEVVQNAEESVHGRTDGGDIGDDWDQVDAPPFGAMMLGGRHQIGNITNNARGFVDAAEAMIGSLLRTGEIQENAIAEIEGTLGIRISGARNASDWSQVDRERRWNIVGRSGVPQRPGTNRSNSNSGGNNNAEGQVLGSIPHVNQQTPPDVGHAGPGGGGRFNEISSMELVFGGPALTGGSSNFDVVSEVEERSDDEDFVFPSAVEAQLFPGGPAASTHARTRQAVHPLLCGVDLPPINSLVSNLLSHGERSIRRGETSPRRSDEWTSWSISANHGGYVVSTSNGNLVRLSRSQLPSSASPRSVPGALVGWSDDGQPFDGSMNSFINAFENALNETIQVPEVDNSAEMQAEEARNVESNNDNEDVNAENDGQDGVGNVETNDGHTERLSEESPPDTITAGEPTASNNDQVDGRGNTDGNSAANREVQAEEQQSGNASNVGDRVSNVAPSDAESVAPSLVEGLRLSDGANEEIDNNNVEREISDSTMIDQNETIENTEETTNEQPSNQETSGSGQNEPNANGLVCPPGMDLGVFNSLPFEMQQEVIEQHQATVDLAAQLDSTSGLDPEALAALPEDMRREVIAQEQRERRLRDAPADPSNAEEMDNASFVASLAPELRRDILLTAEDTFLNSLPPNIIAEAQILRERVHQSRRVEEPAPSQGNHEGTRSDGNGVVATAPVARKKPRHGKLKVTCDRSPVMYLPKAEGQNQRERNELFPTEPFGSAELKSLIQLMFLLSPVRPQRLLQKVFQNICSNATLRSVICNAFASLLSDNGSGAAATVDSLDNKKKKSEKIERERESTFPPRSLIGTAPEVLDGSGINPSSMFFRRRQGNSCAASIAASLPGSLKGSSTMAHVPPVVSTRVVDTLSFLSKNSPRICLDALTIPSHETVGTCFEQMLDLLNKPRYAKSSTNLENLLAMIEIMISPLSGLSRSDDDYEDIPSEEIEAAASIGKEWVNIPRVEISQPRLQLLCSILKMESCRDAAFSRVNGISRRLCKVEANRGHILAELASVAQSLGEDAKRDLRLLFVRMNDVVVMQQRSVADSGSLNGDSERSIAGRSPSSTVTLSSSSSELKLLRVLQTLQSLCSDNQTEENARRKSDGTVFVTPELIEILQGMNLNELWEQLDACLKVVKVLEGIATEDESDEKNNDNGDDEEMMEDNTGGNNEAGDDGSEDMITTGKKLQNSSAGLLTRFLPAIEAFFVVNASATRDEINTTSAQSETTADDVDSNSNPSAQNHEVKVTKLVGGKSVVEFVSENKIILNALVRNNSSLLEKGLRALVQVPRCRSILDFDVKRQWFKTQIRRLRQQASRRRHGSLRLAIRRKYVFEDAYHQLRLRNADEMRSRLHITFRNEEGVDAGGLSREFFGILAKEMFNPNYALFTSTEDGCTFQPNPNSSINPDHLSYFRFVGRIVGKAVADGFLLDAHFTRSLYKHMLGIEPTHHDMEAIDPDYYKNLKMILEYNLADIGLDLTFSIDDNSFGRSQIIDLIPGGRNIAVTDETKARYVSLVCKHRMTTSIKSQIKAYLDGFYELVSPDLIAIFTPRELELLISGLPDIDVHDLKQNTEYQGWKATDPEIVWFWNIMFSLSRSEKAAFLQFVTGSSKVPLAGFAELQGMRGIQKFSIHKAGGSSSDALMSAHTCFNSLDMPKYESEDKMKEKLLYAISEGQTGFLFA